MGQFSSQLEPAEHPEKSEIRSPTLGETGSNDAIRLEKYAPLSAHTPPSRKDAHPRVREEGSGAVRHNRARARRGPQGVMSTEGIVSALAKPGIASRKRARREENAEDGEAMEDTNVLQHSKKKSRRHKRAESYHSESGSLGGDRAASRKHQQSTPERHTGRQQLVEKASNDDQSYWPDAADPEVLKAMNERSLTDADWEDEEQLGKPMGGSQVREHELRMSRNALRGYLRQWSLDDLIYKGKAKREMGEGGEETIVYPQPGRKFKIPEHSTVDKEEAKARRQRLAATRHALLESLVMSELEARRRIAAQVAGGKAQGEQGRTESDMQSNETAIDSAREADSESKQVPPLAKNGAQEGTEQEGQARPPKKKRKKSRAQRAEDGPVLTPPECEEPADKPVNYAGDNAAGRVENSLASQIDEPFLSPDETLSQSRLPKKRKRTSVHRNDDDDDEDTHVSSRTVVPDDSPSASTSVRLEAKEVDGPVNRSKKEADAVEMPARKSKSSTEEHAQQVTSARLTYASNPFTNEEKKIADRIFDETLQKDGITSAELIASIKQWKTCGTFKQEILNAFPERRKDQVRKFCQRRFHGNERGPWTTEQDEALRAAYARNPGKWTTISDDVDRSAGDCKDRWTKHLQYREKAVGPWSVEEENQLLAAVEECIAVIKQEKRADSELIQDRERLEGLVNWSVVAEKLAIQRSAHRCRDKYQSLKVRNSKELNPLSGHGDGKKATQNSSAPASGDASASKKHNTARRACEKFEIGDFYDVFVEIHRSFQNHNQHFHDENNVVWSIVGLANQHSRFSQSSGGGGLRKAALERAMELWPVSAPKLKKKLARADTISAKALVLAKWVEKTNKGHLGEMKRTYLPELINAPADVIKQARSPKHTFRKSKRSVSVLSKDHVTDSGEDEENPADSVEPRSSEGMSSRIAATQEVSDSNGGKEQTKMQKIKAEVEESDEAAVEEENDEAEVEESD